MGASRMGFDCTTATGRKNLSYVWENRNRGYKVDWKLIFEDTFMSLVCKIIGHKPYDSDGDKACKRCHKYI